MDKKHLKRLIITLFVIFLMLACTFPADLVNLGNTNPSAEMEQTRVALGVQQTLIARAGEGTQEPSTEVIENQEQPDSPPPTYTPLPTYTPYPTQQINNPAPTIEQAVVQPTVSNMNMEDQIQNAKILVYEDAYGSYDMFGRALDKRVTDAINALGLTYVTNDHDALGNFLKHLNSGTDWDLVIVSAESRNFVRGELWEAIATQTNKDVALIAELWYLDQIARGKIAPLLSRCGIDYTKNWERLPTADLNNYLVYLLDTESMVFREPQTIGMLIPTSGYAWYGDVGDLLKITGGDAKLLAGTLPNEHSTYGVVAECMEGRVIFQTFSSHDYKYNDVVALWQNYITYTLTNHFNAAP